MMPNYRDDHDRFAHTAVAAAAEPVLDLPPLARNRRLVVFGGTFDPVHCGHVSLANFLIQSEKADEVMFVPALHPPHKDEVLVESPEHRLAMLQLVIEDNPAFSYSDIELQRTDSKSYTIDTLSILGKIYPGDQLFFLMGMDCLSTLHTWHRADELANSSNFIIYPRPGVRVPYYAELLPYFGEHNSQKLLTSVLSGPDVPTWDISSTDLRNACRRGGDLSAYVPLRVWQYIQEHKLYQ